MVTYAAPRLAAAVVLSKAALQPLIDKLRARQFSVIAPVVSESAVVLEEIERAEQMPIGWSTQQTPGGYRLVRGNPGEYFGAVPSAHSWKRFLNLPRTDLLISRKTEQGWTFSPAEDNAPQLALLGVPACDLQAIQLLDRVFLGSYSDPHYLNRRHRLFILAVNCNVPAANCFCQSMGTGPKVKSGYDLAMTELPDSFLLYVGSEAGSELLDGLDWQPATAFDLGRAAQVEQRAERQFKRTLQTEKLPEIVFNRLESSRWDAVAERCLSCGSCTMACPTCFCNTVEESITLDGQLARRTRLWDSCFSMEFSHMHGGNSRPTTRARYRQWLTHKFASWKEQFGDLGCVGCGRCITWCPVGIDVTEELRTLRGMEAK